MRSTVVGSTNPELLGRVAALWDNPAWCQFFECYAPFVRDRCSVYGLDPASIDEVCQRIWIELARRMPCYEYDPGRSFRGWLRRLCHHRAVDLFRERRENRFEAIGDYDLIDGVGAVREDDESDGDAGAGRQVLLREAAEAQAEVRRKVKPARWDAFWRVVIEGESVGRVAEALGLKYATVYAGVNHVTELLREEGRRREVRLGLGPRDGD
jgi:RNA polymerase sigma factor (sigma-70 family)